MKKVVSGLLSAMLILSGCGRSDEEEVGITEYLNSEKTNKIDDSFDHFSTIVSSEDKEKASNSDSSHSTISPSTFLWMYLFSNSINGGSNSLYTNPHNISKINSFKSSPKYSSFSAVRGSSISGGSYGG